MLGIISGIHTTRCSMKHMYDNVDLSCGQSRSASIRTYRYSKYIWIWVSIYKILGAPAGRSFSLRISARRFKSRIGPCVCFLCALFHICFFRRHVYITSIPGARYVASESSRSPTCFVVSSSNTLLYDNDRNGQFLRWLKVRVPEIQKYHRSKNKEMKNDFLLLLFVTYRYE